MDEQTFQPLLGICCPDKPPRVWSVLVTLFGDLAQEEGANLSGAAVGAVLGGVGIRSEAVRVALHRLRKDGWIDSTKNGRKSNYALTAWGRDQCAAASPVIYGPWPCHEAVWLVVPDPLSAAENDTAGMSALVPRLYLSANEITCQTALVVRLDRGQAIPAWVVDRLCPLELRSASQAFLRRLQRLEQNDFVSGDLTPVQTSILRTLIVHEWRRIILKAPDVPDFLISPGWSGPECKSLITKVLAKLKKPDFDQLNDAA